MTNELALNENKIMMMWNDEAQLKTIKDMFAKKTTHDEFQIFVQLGIATGLNPFLREIWAVKYGDNAAQIFVGRDGYRKIISRNPNYEGHIVDAVYANDEFNVDLIAGYVKHIPNFKNRGSLIGAYCIVYMKGCRIPIYVFCELSEYDTGQSLWKTKKATMIKKVAEAQGIRMADQACSGTYSEEEMPDEKTGNHHPKSKKLNESLSITIDGEKVDPETGEVTTEEEPPAQPLLNAPMFTFDEIKTKMEGANNLDTLHEAASVISSMSITKEQHSELSKIYRKRVDEIKKAAE